MSTPNLHLQLSSLAKSTQGGGCKWQNALPEFLQKTSCTSQKVAVIAGMIVLMPLLYMTGKRVCQTLSFATSGIALPAKSTPRAAAAATQTEDPISRANAATQTEEPISRANAATQTEEPIADDHTLTLLSSFRDKITPAAQNVRSSIRATRIAATVLAPQNDDIAAKVALAADRLEDAVARLDDTVTRLAGTAAILNTADTRLNAAYRTAFLLAAQGCFFTPKAIATARAAFTDTNWNAADFSATGADLDAAAAGSIAAAAQAAATAAELLAIHDHFGAAITHLNSSLADLNAVKRTNHRDPVLLSAARAIEHAKNAGFVVLNAAAEARLDVVNAGLAAADSGLRAARTFSMHRLTPPATAFRTLLKESQEK